MLLKPLKISAKNLGYTALESFCPRCYWIKLQMSHNLPWSSFPGIFSSIDSYTKSCVHYIIDKGNKQRGKIARDEVEKDANNNYLKVLPEWMEEIGDIVGYEPIPHWSKNLFYDAKSGITLSGIPDDIWIRKEGKKAIVDFKTAKHTDAQDKLFPMYEIQNNVYDILFGYHADLYLVYMEPTTSKQSVWDGNMMPDGFNMEFKAVVVPVENDRKKVRKALTITREIYEMSEAPQAKDGCKDCEKLDKVMGLLK